MDWLQVQAQIVATRPEPGELVYLARVGTEYTWCVVLDPSQPPHTTPGATPPDAWIYYSGVWPAPADATSFFDDLRAELESMTGEGADRCRWSLDDPWPHGH